MAMARSEVVTEGVEAVYHCISRCVRRAFLCGTDTYSGKSYEHRKDWIKLRIQELAVGYGVEGIGVRGHVQPLAPGCENPSRLG